MTIPETKVKKGVSITGSSSEILPEVAAKALIIIEQEALGRLRGEFKTLGVMDPYALSDRAKALSARDGMHRVSLRIVPGIVENISNELVKLLPEGLKPADKLIFLNKLGDILFRQGASLSMAAVSQYKAGQQNGDNALPVESPDALPLYDQAARKRTFNPRDQDAESRIVMKTTTLNEKKKPLPEKERPAAVKSPVTLTNMPACPQHFGHLSTITVALADTKKATSEELSMAMVKLRVGMRFMMEAPLSMLAVEMMKQDGDYSSDFKSALKQRFFSDSEEDLEGMISDKVKERVIETLTLAQKIVLLARLESITDTSARAGAKAFVEKLIFSDNDLTSDQLEETANKERVTWGGKTDDTVRNPQATLRDHYKLKLLSYAYAHLSPERQNYVKQQIANYVLALRGKVSSGTASLYDIKVASETYILLRDDFTGISGSEEFFKEQTKVFSVGIINRFAAAASVAPMAYWVENIKTDVFSEALQIGWDAQSGEGAQWTAANARKTLLTKLGVTSKDSQVALLKLETPTDKEKDMWGKMVSLLAINHNIGAGGAEEFAVLAKYFKKVKAKLLSTKTGGRTIAVRLYQPDTSLECDIKKFDAWASYFNEKFAERLNALSDKFVKDHPAKLTITAYLRKFSAIADSGKKWNLLEEGAVLLYDAERAYALTDAIKNAATDAAYTDCVARLKALGTELDKYPGWYAQLFKGIKAKFKPIDTDLPGGDDTVSKNFEKIFTKLVSAENKAEGLRVSLALLHIANAFALSNKDDESQSKLKASLQALQPEIVDQSIKRDYAIWLWDAIKPTDGLKILEEIVKDGATVTAENTMPVMAALWRVFIHTGTEKNVPNPEDINLKLILERITAFMKNSAVTPEFLAAGGKTQNILTFVNDFVIKSDKLYITSEVRAAGVALIKEVLKKSDKADKKIRELCLTLKDLDSEFLVEFFAGGTPPAYLANFSVHAQQIFKSLSDLRGLKRASFEGKGLEYCSSLIESMSKWLLDEESFERAFNADDGGVVNLINLGGEPESEKKREIIESVCSQIVEKLEEFGFSGDDFAEKNRSNYSSEKINEYPATQKLLAFVALQRRHLKKLERALDDNDYKQVEKQFKQLPKPLKTKRVVSEITALTTHLRVKKQRSSSPSKGEHSQMSVTKRVFDHQAYYELGGVALKKSNKLEGANVDITELHKSNSSSQSSDASLLRKTVDVDTEKSSSSETSSATKIAALDMLLVQVFSRANIPIDSEYDEYVIPKDFSLTIETDPRLEEFMILAIKLVVEVVDTASFEFKVKINDDADSRSFSTSEDLNTDEFDNFNEEDCMLFAKAYNMIRSRSEGDDKLQLSGVEELIRPRSLNPTL